MTIHIPLPISAKNISKKDKVYNPYKLITIPSNKFKCGAYIPKKYKVDLKNIKEYKGKIKIFHILMVFINILICLANIFSILVLFDVF